MIVLSNKELHLNHLMKMYHQQQNQCLNYSKVDNTIKIENIYASQIVEEIRRERERKVLQSVDLKSVATKA